MVQECLASRPRAVQLQRSSLASQLCHTGVIYLSDRAAAGGSDGSVFKIDGSKVTVIVAKLHTGNPAGISLTQDESTLLVSALQLNSPSDQVLLIDLGTGQIGSITEVI